MGAIRANAEALTQINARAIDSWRKWFARVKNWLKPDTQSCLTGQNLANYSCGGKHMNMVNGVYLRDQCARHRNFLCLLRMYPPCVDAAVVKAAIKRAECPPEPG